MSSTTALSIVKTMLTVQSDITYFGGAEQVPVLWAQYRELRTQLLKMYELPEITENISLLVPPTIPATEERRLLLIRDDRLGAVRQLKEILREVGINGCSDEISPAEGIEWMARRICYKLWDKVRLDDTSSPESRKATVKHGKQSGIKAADTLRMLNARNDAYNRFLLNVLLDGGYASMIDIVDEINHTSDPEIEWLFFLYGCERLDDWQLGIDQLRNSGLQFINEFLWWEAEASNLLVNAGC